MGMTEVYVVRHGETDWNKQGRLQGQEDIPLNEKGRAQALACGRALEKTRFQGIFTSPLSRARETAEKIAQFQACPVSQDTGLLERDYGALSGLTLPQREALAATGRPDGMEPWKSLAQRALSALNRRWGGGTGLAGVPWRMDKRSAGTAFRACHRHRENRAEKHLCQCIAAGRGRLANSLL